MMRALADHEVPYTFLSFPRFAVDADYTYGKLGFLLEGISAEVFRTAFERVSNPELIHSFSNRAVQPDSKIVRDYHSRQARRIIWNAVRSRFRRLFGRGGG